MPKARKRNKRYGRATFRKMRDNAALLKRIAELEAQNRELLIQVNTLANLVKEIDDSGGIKILSADETDHLLERHKTGDPVGEDIRKSHGERPQPHSDRLGDSLLGSVEAVAERIRAARESGQTDLSDILPSLSGRFRLPPEVVETLFGGKEGR